MKHKTLTSKDNERMSNSRFRMMAFMYRIRDSFRPITSEALDNYHIKKGDVIIDYGCGPGSYTKALSQLVGKDGIVYAIDIHPLAIEAVKVKIEKNNLHNVKPILVDGYSTNLEDYVADKIIAFDMFHMVEDPNSFLSELKRLLKRDGQLFIENGHQSRENAKAKIHSSKIWKIETETKKYMQCTPF